MKEKITPIATELPSIPMKQMQCEHVFQTLRRNQWVRNFAAHDLQITLRTLQNHIRRLQRLGYPVEESVLSNTAKARHSRGR